METLRRTANGFCQETKATTQMKVEAVTDPFCDTWSYPAVRELKGSHDALCVDCVVVCLTSFALDSSIRKQLAWFDHLPWSCHPVISVYHHFVTAVSAAWVYVFPGALAGMGEEATLTKQFEACIFISSTKLFTHIASGSVLTEGWQLRW